MSKPQNPFLVQQERIGTVAKLMKAMDFKSKETQRDKAVTDLLHKAKSLDKKDISANDIMDFIESIEVKIRNRIPKILSVHVPIEEVTKTIQAIRKEAVPQWNSLFQRKIRRALREGKIDVARLNELEKLYLKVLSPTITVQDAKGEIKTQEIQFTTQEELDKAEAKTHTTMAKTIAGIKSTEVQFPERTIGRSIQQTFVNNNNPQVAFINAINDDDDNVQNIFLSEEVYELEEARNYYKKKRNVDMVNAINQVINDINNYSLKIQSNPNLQDEGVESALIRKARKVIDEYKKVAQVSKVLTKDLNEMKQKLLSQANAMQVLRNTYSDILMEKPAYVQTSVASRSIQTLRDQFGKTTRELGEMLATVDSLKTDVDAGEVLEIEDKDIKKIKIAIMEIDEDIRLMNESAENIKENLEDPFMETVEQQFGPRLTQEEREALEQMQLEGQGRGKTKATSGKKRKNKQPIKIKAGASASNRKFHVIKF